MDHLSTIDPTKTKAWRNLIRHRKRFNSVHINDLFEADKERFQNFHTEMDDLLFDYSKNIIDKAVIDDLLLLAKQCKLKEAIKSLVAGATINETENRAVLHMALRNKTNRAFKVSGQNVMPEVRSVLKRMQKCVEHIHHGLWKGYTHKPIKNIVNIGIGGSDLGPYMVTEALKPYVKNITPYFVSNVDSSHLYQVLSSINVEETIFIVASKTFTTQETMANAHVARQAVVDFYNNEEAIKKHFIAVSTNSEAVSTFGIDPQNMFEFWDWVGGRFSLTSAIGLSIAISIGWQNFDDLLKGFNAMDIHFEKAPWSENIPVLMALISVWYVNFWGAESEAIIPYDQYMHRFAAYFQQANMESNGKSTSRTGLPVHYHTGPVIWGEPGTNGQHAFFQLIHQGTRFIPCDFIAPAISHNPIGHHHEILLSNFLAQTRALMTGKSRVQVVNEMKSKNISDDQISKIAPFRVFEGNKPTNTFLVKKIDPFTLGRLIAMYEHKIFVQGVIWNIFSFDQWGVELGKQLANEILPVLCGQNTNKVFDQSTEALIAHIKKMSSVVQ